MTPIRIVSAIILLSGPPAMAQQAAERPDNAPALGAPIPQVSAVRLQGGERVDLSKPVRLTVLIFGSHT